MLILNLIVRDETEKESQTVEQSANKADLTF